MTDFQKKGNTVTKSFLVACEDRKQAKTLRHLWVCRGKSGHISIPVALKANLIRCLCVRSCWLIQLNPLPTDLNLLSIFPPGSVTLPHALQSMDLILLLVVTITPICTFESYNSYMPDQYNEITHVQKLCLVSSTRTLVTVLSLTSGSSCCLRRNKKKKHWAQMCSFAHWELLILDCCWH